MWRHCKVIFLKAPKSTGKVSRNSVLTLGQEQKAETMLSLLIKAASGAGEVPGYKAAPWTFQVLDKCQICRPSQKPGKQLRLSEYDLWFRLCTQRKQLWNAIKATLGVSESPGVITVVPPAPAMATVRWVELSPCNRSPASASILVNKSKADKCAPPPDLLHQLIMVRGVEPLHVGVGNCAGASFYISNKLSDILSLRTGGF